MKIIITHLYLTYFILLIPVINNASDLKIPEYRSVLQNRNALVTINSKDIGLSKVVLDNFCAKHNGIYVSEEFFSYDHYDKSRIVLNIFPDELQAFLTFVKTELGKLTSLKISSNYNGSSLFILDNKIKTLDARIKEIEKSFLNNANYLEHKKSNELVQLIRQLEYEKNMKSSRYNGPKFFKVELEMYQKHKIRQNLFDKIFSVVNKNFQSLCQTIKIGKIEGSSIILLMIYGLHIFLIRTGYI